MCFTRLCARLSAVVLALTLASSAFATNPVLRKPLDFNGDGKDDILWRNSVTGQTATWLMNGLATTNPAVIYADPNWTVANVGDLNGDGNTDLVWRNTA